MAARESNPQAYKRYHRPSFVITTHIKLPGCLLTAAAAGRAPIFSSPNVDPSGAGWRQQRGSRGMRMPQREAIEINNPFLSPPCRALSPQSTACCMVEVPSNKSVRELCARGAAETCDRVFIFLFSHIHLTKLGLTETRAIET